MNLWKEYLYFSRKERIALLVLLLVIALLIVLPRITTLQIPPPQPDLAAMNQLAAAPVIADTNRGMPVATPGLFRFDPNTLNAAGLLQLGMREKVVRTLINYRNKGGHFYNAADLRKVYGLRPEEANRLIPYIEINVPGKNNRALAVETPATSTPIQPAITTVPPNKASGKQFAYTDINTATAADWKRFPGIGEVLSKRIVAFRYKLGGFQSVQQIRQTYGLPDSVFEKMQPYLRMDTGSSEIITIPP